MGKAKQYLKTVDEAVNLFEAIDLPPSRIRAILNRTFKDYFDRNIDEDTLIQVGSIVHHLQVGTWDYDPDIMSVTCSLDDQSYEAHRLPKKEKREKLYKECYQIISENQTITISIPKELIKGDTMIYAQVKKAIEKYLKNK